MRAWLQRGIAATVVLTLAATGYGQEESAPPPLQPQSENPETGSGADAEGEPTAADKEQQDGFRWAVLVGAAPNWTYSRYVLDIDDGHHLSLAGAGRVNLGTIAQKHEWFFELSTLQAFTRLPALDRFITSRDMLGLDTIYRYAVLPSFGPFNRFRIKSSLFPTNDVRRNITNYQITEVNGEHEENLKRQLLKLTSPFMPLRLRDTVGLFFRPWHAAAFTWEWQVGWGTWLTFADNQRVIIGKETETILVRELDDFYNLGPELAMVLHGYLWNDRFSYRAGGEFMVPVLRFGDHLVPGESYELIDVELYTALAVKPVSWLALEWQFKANRETGIRKEFQLHNYLMIAFTYANKTPNARVQ